MGYTELNEHYEFLNKDKITKYNNSYDKYLDEHERNIGNKSGKRSTYRQLMVECSVHARSLHY